MSENEAAAWGNFYCWLHNLAERRRQKQAAQGDTQPTTQQNEVKPEQAKKRGRK